MQCAGTTTSDNSSGDQRWSSFTPARCLLSNPSNHCFPEHLTASHSPHRHPSPAEWSPGLQLCWLGELRLHRRKARPPPAPPRLPLAAQPGRPQTRAVLQHACWPSLKPYARCQSQQPAGKQQQQQQILIATALVATAVAEGPPAQSIDALPAALELHVTWAHWLLASGAAGRRFVAWRWSDLVCGRGKGRHSALSTSP